MVHWEGLLFWQQSIGNVAAGLTKETRADRPQPHTLTDSTQIVCPYRPAVVSDAWQASHRVSALLGSVHSLCVLAVPVSACAPSLRYK